MRQTIQAVYYLFHTKNHSKKYKGDFMKYYIIKDNEIFIANQQSALSNYYAEQINILPEDYDSEKYFVQDGELVPDPDYQEKQEEKERLQVLNNAEAQLNELDLKAIRAMRAILADEDSDEDRIKLIEYENQAQEIRKTIKSLQK